LWLEQKTTTLSCGTVNVVCVLNLKFKLMQPLIIKLRFNKYLSILNFLFFQGAVLVILLIIILLLVFLVKTHSKKKSEGEILVCGHFYGFFLQ